MSRFTFYEFFAGGGMARAGLGSAWDCRFANDFDGMKARVYRANWGDEHFRHCDINSLSCQDLPEKVDLAWASFPCQDLSLAGNAAGLGTVDDQTRSGAFWAFWRLMERLIDAKRQPKLIVLENVYGCLTANDGRDFALIARSLSLGGYTFGALILDAADFLPQSRPRVFVVAAEAGLEFPEWLTAPEPDAAHHPSSMQRAVDRLSEIDQDSWRWLRPLDRSPGKLTLAACLLDEPSDVRWHTPDETRRLLEQMAPSSLKKLAEMKRCQGVSVGTIYKRTRADENGERRQRAELRTDGVAGCLRTPGGGSSRQLVITVTGGHVRTRLLSAREAARLMGLPDSYRLPDRYNEAYHVCGDGVAVPVVSFLARAVLEPTLATAPAQSVTAAA